MCCKDGSIDPDRTASMKEHEEELLHNLQKHRTTLADEYALRDNPSGWVDEYISDLTGAIESHLLDTRRFIEKNTSIKNSEFWDQKVHGERRLIGLFHQERELIKQGLDVPLLALEANASILHGNRYVQLILTCSLCTDGNSFTYPGRVNKREFRKVYGF